MTNYWVIQPDDVSHFDDTTVNPASLRHFRHGNYFEKHDENYYLATNESNHSELLTASVELSPELLYNIVEANYPYDNLANNKSTVTLLSEAVNAKQAGASDITLKNRVYENTYGSHVQQMFEPITQWKSNDAYFISDGETGKITIAPKNKTTPLINKSLYSLQITSNGEWCDSLSGTGIKLISLTEYQKTPTPTVFPNDTRSIIDKYHLEPNILKTDDVYLVEYGKNKSCLISRNHNESNDEKVSQQVSQWNSKNITKIVEAGKLINGFELNSQTTPILSDRKNMKSLTQDDANIIYQNSALTETDVQQFADELKNLTTQTLQQ